MTIDNWIQIGTIIFGLIGVFISILYSAHQARKQQEHQWKYERGRVERKEANERASIRNALTVELEDIRLRIQTSLEVEEEKEKEIEGIPPIPVFYEEFVPEIYHAILPRIITLSSIEVGALIFAYQEFIKHTRPTPMSDLMIRDAYLERTRHILKNIDIVLKILKDHS